MAGRLNLKVSQKGFILIDDTYNANPLSMRVAFDTVKRIGKKKRKVAILGDMLELGAYSIEAHQEVGVDLEKYGFNRIFLVGSYKEECKRGALSAGLPKEAISLCSNLDDTIAKTRQDLKKGDIVLVKGSRGMKMEFVAEALLQKSE